MYSDGNRKTVSELQREAEATRNMIVEEARHLERIKKASAKTQFSIDQLFRFFAREVETEEERRLLVDLLMSNPPDVHIECLPLLPVAIAIANGRMTNASRIYAAENNFIDDSALIFLAHILRFSPQASQIDYVDISGTRVTEKGLSFMLEMAVERNTEFTLVMKNIAATPEEPDKDPHHAKYMALLSTALSKKICNIVMG